MEFTVGRPDAVRAINQRWLLNFWKSHLGQHAVPQWQSVAVDKLSGVSPNLSLLIVTGRGDDTRFMIRFNGAVVGDIYGAADQHGKYMDEVIPAALRAGAIAPYRQTVHEGRPVYTIHDLVDRSGRIVHLERLLLPFAGDGETVDRILASHELVSLDGAFDGRSLMVEQPSPPALKLAAIIDIGRA